MMRFVLVCCVVGGMGVVAAGCTAEQRTCDEPAAGELSRVAPLLSGTGLYATVQPEVLADGVMSFAPRFELWSDGASKRRWLWLPPGTQVDTREGDAWRFPEGTRAWKEFTRDGTRVETRLLQKVGPRDSDWVMVAYAWRADGSDAELQAGGARDVASTGHDIPSAGTCRACHDGMAGRVLGVGAVQLAYDAPDGMVDLEDLRSRGLLSHDPGRVVVPGTAVQQAALGYLHANCAHCHNFMRPPPEPPAVGPVTVPDRLVGPRCFDPATDFSFQLRLGELGRAEETSTYRTAVGTVFRMGDPGASRALQNLERGTMPPVGVEIPHADGAATLRAWLTESR